MSELRKKNLIQKLHENKLTFKNSGDCYSYIKYGYPSIEEILEKEVSMTVYKTHRRIRLAKKLSKINITLDESLPSCYNYINSLGCKTLKEIVQDVEIETFLKQHTNYLELIKTHPPSKAQKIALKNYVFQNNYKIKVPDKIINNIVLSFD